MSAARLVRVVSGVAAVVALLVIVASFALRGPVPLAGLLVIPAVPLVGLGQVLAIIIITTRQRSASLRAGLDPNRLTWRRPPREVRQTLTSGLPPAPRWALRLVVIGSLAAVFVAPLFIPALAGPTPETTPDRCEATLTERGLTRCVDPDELERYRGFTQRFGAVGLLVFFAIHAATAHGVVRDEEMAARARPEAPPG